jgi:hypothetical protein
LAGGGEIVRVKRLAQAAESIVEAIKKGVRRIRKSQSDGLISLSGSVMKLVSV